MMFWSIFNTTRPINSVNAVARDALAPQPSIVGRSHSSRALPPVRRITRSRSAAFIEAAIAAHRGMSLLTYLAHRLPDYLAEVPSITSPLPTLGIDGERGLLSLSWPDDRRHPALRILADPSFALEDDDAVRDPVAADARWLRVSQQAFLDVLSPELQRAQAGLGEVERLRRALRERDERAAHAQADLLDTQWMAAAAGGKADTPGDDAEPTTAAGLMRLRAFGVVLVLMEAVAVFASFANASGIDVTGLDTELSTNTIGIAMWAIAANVWSALSVYLTKIGLRGIHRAVRAMPPPNYLPWGVYLTGSGVLLVLVMLSTWAIAALRQSVGAGAAAMQAALSATAHPVVTSQWTFFLLALVPMIGGAVVHLQIEPLVRARMRAVPPTPLEALEHLRDVLRNDIEEVRRREAALLSSMAAMNAAAHDWEQSLRAMGEEHDRVRNMYLADVAKAIARDAFAYRVVAANKPHLLPASTQRRERHTTALRTQRRVS